MVVASGHDGPGRDAEGTTKWRPHTQADEPIPRGLVTVAMVHVVDVRACTRGSCWWECACGSAPALQLMVLVMLMILRVLQSFMRVQVAVSVRCQQPCAGA